MSESSEINLHQKLSTEDTESEMSRFYHIKGMSYEQEQLGAILVTNSDEDRKYHLKFHYKNF